MKRIKRGPLEIAVFSLSLVFILGTLGLFVYDGIIKKSKPPLIAIDINDESIKRNETGEYELRLQLRNAGDEPAQDVRVEVALTSTPGGEERSEVMIAFLPEGSSRDAVVLFTSDPREGEIEARTVSYTVP